MKTTLGFVTSQSLEERFVYLTLVMILEQFGGQRGVEGRLTGGAVRGCWWGFNYECERDKCCR